MNQNKEVNRYISEVSDEFRPYLVSVRDWIFKYLPDGQETYAYHIPVYRYKGKPIFSIAAFKDHYSLITQDKKIGEKFPDDLKNFKISGTTIHFTKKNSLTEGLLKKIIQDRVASRNYQNKE